MDPYKILGVACTATTTEIKNAYKKKILECHPDKGGNHDEFINIKMAYEKIQCVIEFNIPTNIDDNTNIYEERCKYYRTKLSEFKTGQCLEDPFPNTMLKITILFRLIFRKEKLTKCVNARVQNDIGFSLWIFLDNAASFIPVDIEVSESYIRLASLLKKLGFKVFPIVDIYDFDEYFSYKNAEIRLYNSFKSVEEEYESNKEIKKLDWIQFYPETIELFDALENDLKIIADYFRDTLPSFKKKLNY